METVKKIISENLKGFPSKIRKIRKSELYYENKNDILRRRNPLVDKIKDKDPDNPLRNADNRISHSFHQLLVNQKAAYAMTVPPLFDVDDKTLNQEIVKLLGDVYPKVAKDLCINASNAGIAWIHVWRDEENHNFFRYAVIDSKQIIPIYSKRLTNQLEGILRVYEDYDDSGDVLLVYEYWNNEECSVYSRKKSKTLDNLEEYEVFNLIDVATNQPAGATNTYKHGWSRLPFIPLRNNPLQQPDLEMYKALIDVYDKVFSGFVNDVDDIQEIIYVLTNYGGEDKKEFLSDLKNYKMVQVEDDGQGAKGGVDTLAIDIPIEARSKILEMTRDSIFVHGQGVDPQKNIGQNNSGAALKYMYSLLELKASMLETEFRLGFAELIRFILEYSGKDSNVTIKQTWTRSAINNDLEQADIVSKLAPVTSKENLAKANPIVQNWETEVANLKSDLEETFRSEDDYRKEQNDE
ncbi:phage portal protein [Enterococcus innesii]|uniref:phage portal protein n=1 Tax=Enterococcus innesii TaxID=2839759 RepID=UPI00232B8074|nr:phage portal protein [Enterococcus innesii]MDC0753241.1 phage portal protein [Enterococcus innesii]MDC0777330.1 phage portal protein [Enterococcus innesii]MDC0780541.1 phage portal protein [Enterococcus innesii]MDC0784074.1 phage portal protein [Enterococcus innesii]